MDATSALADLTEISPHVEAAVVVDVDGAVVASTIAREPDAAWLAEAGLALLETATSRFGSNGRSVTQLEVALREGSIFVAQEEGLGIVARTSPRPSSGLVLYDLMTCLRAVVDARQKPKPRSRTAKRAETADA